MRRRRGRRAEPAPVTVSSSDDELFEAIVADIQADYQWRRVRRAFLAIGLPIAVLAFLAIGVRMGRDAALAFSASYSLGSAVVAAKGRALFAPRRWLPSP